MYKTFYQQANAQSSLQTTVAEKFGYQLSNQDFGINNKSNKKSAPKILRVVKPYALRDKELPYNQEIERLNLELDIIKNQRQRAANPSQSNIQIMQMLDQRIHQYNYLLEHKHLSDKDSNQTRKILKIQPKTEAQLILEKINKEKQQLLKNQNLSIKEQYIMNKNINTLYRKFKESIFTTKTIRPSLQQKTPLDLRKTQILSNSKGASNIGTSFSKSKQKNLAKSMLNPERQKQIRSQSLQKSGSPTKNSIRLFQSMINRKDFQISQPKKGYSLINKQNDDIQQIKRQIFGRNKVLTPRKPTQQDAAIAQDQEGSVANEKLEEQNGSSCIMDRSLGQISVRNKNGNSLDSPYAQREILERGKQLDRKIKNSEEVMDLWKVRIADSKHQMEKIINRKNGTRKQLFTQMKVIQSQNPQCENSVYLTPIQQIERRIKNSIPKQHEQESTQLQLLPSKIRQKKSTQKRLISSYLQKRNAKFMKPYGNKILIRYDSVTQASSMIDGNNKLQDQYLKEKQKQAEMALSMLKSRSKVQSKAQNKQMTDLEELQTISKKVLQLDEDHYWTMAKNEKINLLIKSNKH